VEQRLEELPGRPTVPERLVKLGKALEDCCRQRPIQAIVVELKRNLNVLGDGMEPLQILKAELTPDAVRVVRALATVRDYHLAQLEEFGALADLEADAEAIQAQLASETPWRAVHTTEDAAQRVKERYAEVRGRLLAQQGEAVERAQARLRAAAGFEKLSPDAAHRVVRPILDARVETTREATSPTLAVLRDTFAARIGPAEERARDLLDLERNKVEPQKVVKIEANLQGREIQSREQLRALLAELEALIGPALDRGDKVRLG